MYIFYYEQVSHLNLNKRKLNFSVKKKNVLLKYNNENSEGKCTYI